MVNTLMYLIIPLGVPVKGKMIVSKKKITGVPCITFVNICPKISPHFTAFPAISHLRGDGHNLLIFLYP
jgi:hypothetical protein